MLESKELLAELDGKVTGLLTQFKRLNELSIEQTQEINDLKSRLQAKDTTIDQLKAENEVLKQAAPTENQDELKFKIGEMVKEIDRCISLLKV